MMWHQVQLLSAVKYSNALLDEAERMSGQTSAAPASTAVPPSSSTTISTTASSSQPMSLPHVVEPSDYKLGDWVPPALPDPRQSSTNTEDFRAQTMTVISQCMQDELASSTVASYESVIKNEVANASHALDIDILPMVTEAQFFALFGALKAAHGEQLRWSRVRVLKTALVHWHKRRFTQCVFDSWTAPMSAFWNGLSRNCLHDSIGKVPSSSMRW